MASNADPVAAPTEFHLFQCMPIELQCLVWDKTPFPSSLIPFDQHDYPTKAEVDSPTGLYTNSQLHLRRKMMSLCKSARLTFTLDHKLYYVLKQSDGALFTATNDRLIPSNQAFSYDPIRLNLKTDVLSRQFELIRPFPGQPRNLCRLYPQRKSLLRVRPATALDWTNIPQVQTQPGQDSEVDGPIPKIDVLHRHGPQNPNLIRHVHIDLLIRRPGSLPTINLGPHEQGIDLDTFIMKTFTMPQESCSNLRTITFSLHGPGALHKVLRAVKITPPPLTPDLPPIHEDSDDPPTPTTNPQPAPAVAHAILPSPVKYHDRAQARLQWSDDHIESTIRTHDGALIIRPKHLLTRQAYALFRVITPLGPKIDRTTSENEWPLENFHNDEKQWREALKSGLSYQDYLHAVAVSAGIHPLTDVELHAQLMGRIEAVIWVGHGDSARHTFWLDGICGPNYAMEDAKVFN